MLVTGVIVGGIMAGVATIGQHVLLVRQHKELKELKAEPKETKKEEPNEVNDFAYLIQGKQPKTILQKELDTLLKGDEP